MANAKIKTIPTTVDVVKFLADIDDSQQRQDSEKLIEVMAKVSNEPPVLWGSAIIGFDSYHYVYDSGREGDTPRIAFSPRKGKLTLYVLDEVSKYSAILEKLGKHKTSKACLYVTRLSDVDMNVLEELIATAYKDSFTHK